MSNKIQTTDTLRLIQCTVGDETYGLDMSWVRNIQRADRLRLITQAEDDTAGFIGWLPGPKSDIPVFSLANRLGQLTLPAKNEALQRIIVLPSPIPPSDTKHQGEQLWALLVDHVSQVIQISREHFYSLPSIVTNPVTNYFEGIIRLEENLILLLSPAWLHPQTVSDSEGVTHIMTDHNIAGHNMASDPQTPAADQSGAENPEPVLSTVAKQAEIELSNAQNLKSSVGRIMVFSTSQEEQALSFGLSITQIPEVLRPLPLTPVPTAPSFVLGLINWRDRPVPVIDLAARLGLESATKPVTNGHTRLLIARGADQNTFVGFSIQAGVQVLRLPLAHQPASRILPLDQTLVKGAVNIEGKTLVLPDIQKLSTCAVRK